MLRLATVTAIVLVGLFTVPMAMAQIYECDGLVGPIFSDQECGPEAKLVTIEETSGLGGGVPVSVQIDLARGKLYREQRRYRNILYRHRDQDTAVIDSQISALNSQKSKANNNLAGATYAAGIDQQIAALRASRSQVTISYREQLTQAELEGF